MIPDVREVEGALTPGRLYRVPCIRSTDYPILYGREWWPVFGAPHSDVELSFEWEHYHFDLRFLSDPFVRRWVGDLHQGTIRTHITVRPHVIESRRLRCFRAWPVPFPAAQSLGQLTDEQATLWRGFEDRYAAARLCRVCPHRGMPAADMPIVDGLRVCHGHGLGWDVKTGALVRRHVRPALPETIACAT